MDGKGRCMDNIFVERLWRSALPTGSASPLSQASSEGGEMLAFAHKPI
jgi:hypothetical protein